MKYKTSEADLILSQMLQGEEGEKLKFTLDTKIEELEWQLSIFKEQLTFCNTQINICENRGLKENNKVKKGYYELQKQLFKDCKTIANISCFITVISTDIKSTQKGIYFEKTEWCRRNSAKHMCNILYEASSDVFKQLRGDFKDLITSRIVITPFESELKDIRERLNIYKEENSPYFYKIRNNVAAHKDKDSANQLSIIEDISWNDIVGRALLFESIINDLGKFMQKVTELSLENLKKSPIGKKLI